MITKKFKKAYLMDELDLPYGGKSNPYFVESNLIDTSRWSIGYELIFKDKDGTIWATEYNVGATELQEEGPWEFEDEIECTQVELKEIVVRRYVPV